MKWQGYEDDENTWEPSQHLPEDIIREFHEPSVTVESVNIYSKLLEEGVRQRLKCRKEVFSVSFPAELYRFAFGTYKEKLVDKEDFRKLNLRENWDRTFRSNGVGMGLKFPVRIKSVIRYIDDFVPVNGVLAKQKHLVEKLRVTSSTGIVFSS